MASEPNQSSKKKQQLTSYGKYSAMGFQMFAIIGLGTYGGVKLDEWLHISQKPVFTIILSLLSVFGSIYFVVKDLLKK